jgi:putative endopeptidase
MPRSPLSRPTLRPLAATITLALLLGACTKPAPAPADQAGAKPASAAAAAPAKATLGTFGFDVAGMDKSAVPGDNFFQYANGTWAKTFEIPADKSGYSSFTRLSDQAAKDTRAIIDATAKDANASGEAAQIRDYYNAFMDEAAIERAGLAPLQPRLDAIAAISDQASLAKAIGGTVRADVDIMNATNYYTPNLFGVWINQAMDNPAENLPYLMQGGLGLPDRSFYLDAEQADLRTKYQAHIAKVLTLAGDADADAKAARIMALETAIAKVHATQEDTNDVKKGTNYWTRADFDAKAKGMDWSAFLEGAQLGKQARFVAWQPGAIAGISKLVASQPLDTWKEYLRFHALDSASGLLPKAYADEGFAFYGTTLNGTPQQRERWKRGVDAVNGALGEAVGKIYVQQHFPAETKAHAEELVKNLLTAFGQRIDKLDWMTPETKARAKAKLSTLQISIGYPEKWHDYAGLEVRPGDALGNAQRASLFEYQRQLAKLGQAPNHDEFYMLPHTVNALNVPLENRLVFPAAILGAPFFDAAADDAVNYGAIGSVIGHEISHSFDSSGALFDEKGKMENWWAPEDFKHFEAACAALAAQYDQYEPFPGVHLKGQLELAENVADVAGLATAYDAYKLSQQGKPETVIDGFTPDQRFYLGFAQAWRSKAREAAYRNSITTGTHAPGPFRSETVRNQDPWYAAFDVKPGQARYLAPEKRVKIW